jgi:DNA-binding CsgD family transcriptional regulator
MLEIQVMPLTPRQVEVMQLLAFGMTQREIAQQLGMSYFTVGDILRRAKKRLRSPTLCRAIALAVADGIVSAYHESEAMSNKP